MARSPTASSQMEAAMQPDLLSLAARVEKLTGPDRDVDAEVARAFGLAVSGYMTALGWVHTYRKSELSGWLLLPSYTRSVDALLALIKSELPEARLMMSVGDDFSSAMITVGWGARKRILCPQVERPDNHVAICAVAAFLRAKAAQQQMEADRP